MRIDFLLLILLLFHGFSSVRSKSLVAIMGQTLSSTQFYLYGKKHFTK